MVWGARPFLLNSSPLRNAIAAEEFLTYGDDVLIVNVTPLVYVSPVH